MFAKTKMMQVCLLQTVTRQKCHFPAAGVFSPEKSSCVDIQIYLNSVDIQNLDVSRHQIIGRHIAGLGCWAGGRGGDTGQRPCVLGEAATATATACVEAEEAEQCHSGHIPRQPPPSLHTVYSLRGRTLACVNFPRILAPRHRHPALHSTAYLVNKITSHLSRIIFSPSLSIIIIHAPYYAGYFIHSLE